MKNQNARTYYCILCEMSGFDYEGTKAEIALAKAVKTYFLETINDINNSNYYDPIFACTLVSFYGHSLSWNKNSWRKSAAIVYQYFKAYTIIKKIRSYEAIYKETIISDYMAALNYLYDCLSKDKEIDYWMIPGVCKAFEYVPISVLDEKLEKFKQLYE